MAKCRCKPIYPAELVDSEAKGSKAWMAPVRVGEKVSYGVEAKPKVGVVMRVG